MKSQSARWILATLLGFPAAAPLAADPLLTRNESLLARSAALPELGRVELLGTAVTDLRLGLDLTSEYHSSQNATESVVLDGESQVWRLRARHGFASGVEAGVELSFVQQGGGFLDSSIETWHEVFSLPDGGRPDVEANRFRYQYQRDGVLLLDLDDPQGGVGDVRLDAGWALAPGSVLRGLVQLPSGDDETLTGGALGAALWLDQRLPLAPGSRWSGFVSAGGSASDARGPLESVRRREVAVAGFGLAYRWLEGWSLLGQVVAHSELYQGSELDPFRPGVQLALGSRWRLTRTLNLELGFQEDLVVAASPDFSAQATLSWRKSRPAAE